MLVSRVDLRLRLPRLSAGAFLQRLVECWLSGEKLLLLSVLGFLLGFFFAFLAAAVTCYLQPLHSNRAELWPF